METSQIKKVYDELLKKEGPETYEYKRWFSTPQREAGYDMTKWAIVRRLDKISPKPAKCLELGPGPGTWTKLLLTRFPNSQFDLVDISEEMSRMVRENLKDYQNVTVHNTDFLAYMALEQYDFFFSSRALEYFPEKAPTIQKIYRLLQNGSSGIVITKMPKYWRYRLLGRRIPEFHKNQISPRDLKQILKICGFNSVQAYPAVTIFPLLKCVLCDRILFWLLRKMPLNPISSFFCESYVISFKKI